MTHEEFEALPLSVKDAMLWAKQRQEMFDHPRPMRPSELLSVTPPAWSRRDSEMDYRRGFIYGFSYAITLCESLKSKGFARVQEVVNILTHFQYDTLNRWRGLAGKDAVRGDCKTLQEHPRLEQESWWDLRKQVLLRDSSKCTQCESTEALEVHHIQAVCEGGLPITENLITLCKPCHSAV